MATTATTIQHPLRSSDERFADALVQAGLVSVGWCAAVVLAHRVDPTTAVRHLALGIHLAGLAVGFGAVLAVDVVALRALAGRRAGLSAAIRFAGSAEAWIWSGFAALALSGVFLRPHFGSAWTAVSLSAVLLVGLNGVYARTLRQWLTLLPSTATAADIPRPLALRALASGAISQAAWWTAIVIGLLNR
ncbi:hypothetical protein [Streptacidiphilus carbonis]|uniref:hypothetical protein n=1 Tax=Streptacidiphilus carbonis TaxID=105422 RepID=UPI0006945719|nr:hypothetical protein [Streptacidiphilus carbonis]